MQSGCLVKKLHCYYRLSFSIYNDTYFGQIRGEEEELSLNAETKIHAQFVLKERAKGDFFDYLSVIML